MVWSKNNDSKTNNNNQKNPNNPPLPITPQTNISYILGLIQGDILAEVTVTQVTGRECATLYFYLMSHGQGCRNIIFQ